MFHTYQLLREKTARKIPALELTALSFGKVRDSYSKLQDEYFDFITSRDMLLNVAKRKHRRAFICFRVQAEKDTGAHI